MTLQVTEKFIMILLYEHEKLNWEPTRDSYHQENHQMGVEVYPLLLAMMIFISNWPKFLEVIWL